MIDLILTSVSFYHNHQVVQNAVRQLQHCVTERAALDCVTLFTAEQKQNGAGGLCRLASKRAGAELTYQRKAEQKLQDENCFKVYIVSVQIVFDSIELSFVVIIVTHTNYLLLFT